VALIPLRSPSEILGSFRSLSSILKKGSKPFHDQYIGWPGGGSHYTVYWRSRDSFWIAFQKYKGRFWCGFGTNQPTRGKGLSITCEINAPLKGVDRRLAGVFVRDDSGIIYLAHSGRVGGGRRGIGKTAFLEYWRGENIEPVEWPDKKQTSVILIGRIDRAELSAQIGHFIHEVDAFKKQVVMGSWNQTNARFKDKYTPEFTGTRKGYRILRVIEARCDHGRVISGLAEFLKRKRLRFANDKQRDIYILAKKQKGVEYLFEVKTDSSTTSLYQGIGQALYHTALYSPRPKPVLVMPGQPNKAISKVLRRIGINFVGYRMKDDRPRFSGLDVLLGS
jgi:hypothetical protein